MKMATVEFQGFKYWFRDEVKKAMALMDFAVTYRKWRDPEILMRSAEYVTKGDQLIKSRDGRFPIEIDLSEAEQDVLFVVGMKDLYKKVWGQEVKKEFSPISIPFANLLVKRSDIVKNALYCCDTLNVTGVQHWMDEMASIDEVLRQENIDVTGRIIYVPVDEETYDCIVEYGVILVLRDAVAKNKASGKVKTEVGPVGGGIAGIPPANKGEGQKNSEKIAKDNGVSAARAKIAKLRKNHKKIPQSLRDLVD